MSKFSRNERSFQGVMESSALNEHNDIDTKKNTKSEEKLRKSRFNEKE